jgi:5-methylcytosine-specific restriction endonuclease McrA
LSRKPNCECFICKKEIYRRPSQLGGKVFCSLECVGIGQRENERTCPVCGKGFVGRKTCCSRACSKINREGERRKREPSKSKPRIWRTKLASIRGGFCEECGNENFAILQVHHIKERANGGSDDDDNLKLLCPNCHAKTHLGFVTYDEYIRKDG